VTFNNCKVCCNKNTPIKFEFTSPFKTFALERNDPVIDSSQYKDLKLRSKIEILDELCDVVTQIRAEDKTPSKREFWIYNFATQSYSNMHDASSQSALDLSSDLNCTQESMFFSQKGSMGHDHESFVGEEDAKVDSATDSEDFINEPRMRAKQNEQQRRGRVKPLFESPTIPEVAEGYHHESSFTSATKNTCSTLGSFTSHQAMQSKANLSCYERGMDFSRVAHIEINMLGKFNVTVKFNDGTQVQATQDAEAVYYQADKAAIRFNKQDDADIEKKIEDDLFEHKMEHARNALKAAKNAFVLGDPKNTGK